MKPEIKLNFDRYAGKFYGWYYIRKSSNIFRWVYCHKRNGWWGANKSEDIYFTSLDEAEEWLFKAVVADLNFKCDISIPLRSDREKILPGIMQIVYGDSH